MSGAEDTSLSPALPVAAVGAAVAAATRPRGRLFRKYALLVIALVGAALLINSAFDFWFSYQENKAALVRVQQEKADAAATRIGEFVGEIERQIGWTTHAQWASGPIDQRRQDYFRLLRQVPAITELAQLDAEGREQIKVSRLSMDVVGSAADFSQSPAFIQAKAHRIWFSPVYFRKQSEPYMTLAVERDGRNAGVTIAEINLKLIWDVITALKIGEGGYAYVVDGHGRLIAHPDISLVLRDTDLSKLPQVAAALAPGPELRPEPGPRDKAQAVTVARNLGGRTVLTAHAAIAPLGWRVFVEVPLAEAFAPLYGAALRTLLLLAVGLVAATLVALVLARRMTGPIRAIAAGAERIGLGELDRRIEIHTGDELEALAEQFNRMGADLQKSYAELEQRVADRTAELSESLDQQTATAEVLQVINSSPGDLAPVFDAMLEKALALCGAAFGIMLTYDGEHFHDAALRGVPEAFAEHRRRNPPVFHQGSGPTRLLHGENIVHHVDLLAEARYQTGNATGRALIDLGGARTLLAVALRKDGRLLGTISIYRQEVRPFSEKQIALLQNFAAQAVIAMENARLITETREALDQQTATAEVLGVINASPGDLIPVFDTILEAAHSLCGAELGVLLTYDGERFWPAAALGAAERFSESTREGFCPGPGNPFTRVVDGEEFVHIPDVSELAGQHPDDQGLRIAAEIGLRTFLIIPLRKDDRLLGAITANRREVRPFTDKEIALLQNFAAQAVIAMENARLITETREALEQQTATAEVLQVINSSPGDLVPVFDAILEKAHTLCGAAHGSLTVYDGEFFRAVATHGMPDEFASVLRRPRPAGFVQQRLQAGERFVGIADMKTLTVSPSDIVTPFGIEAGIRSQLFVPLRKDGVLLGYITAHRREVQPFSEKEITLLENFAAQAVIAMENARLIAETREALEQQTATAEVLQVINSSPGDLAPVFDAMLEKARSLCGIAHGSLQIYDGQQFRAVAVQGLPEPIADRLREGFRPGPNNPMRRLLDGDSFVHIPDLAQVDDPQVRVAVEHGSRTLLCIPLRKDDLLIGQIVAVRQEVRPFTDKQIALLQNFAAQAVIAMENARLMTETREALEQQTATAEVLQVINSSPGDLAPVFDAMLDKAAHLCQAAFGLMNTYDGEEFHTVAVRGVPGPLEDCLLHLAAPQPGPLSSPMRIIRGETVVQMEDIAASEGYRLGEARTRAIVELGGARSYITMALRKDGRLLGNFSLYRQEVRPFSDKQIALLQNFAAQAVIAIENTRLITETREALEQQTATAEVLGVINASPGDLAPVFDAMLDKATRLCEAAYGIMQTYDGERFRTSALRGVPAALAELWLSAPPAPGPNSPLTRIAGGEDFVHVEDYAASPGYEAGEPRTRAMVDLGGAHSYVVVALRKDGELLGTIAAYRQEVRPFSDKQIALLQNFAAQAVIAMENARLITETREALDQQTATAEILQVINSSPGDLAPVFQAIVEKAHALCGATYGSLQLWDGEKFRGVAMRGFPEAMVEALRLGYSPGPNMPCRRLVEGESVAHCADLAEIDDPTAQQGGVALAGIRTILYVALRKDDVLLGQIVAARREVRPFSEKEIALVESFAAQAVIAMENARLITETREALEQQTATAEVLQVINSSPGDLAPVFDAVLEKAMHLCEAALGVLWTYDGEAFRAAASRGAPPAYAEFLANGPRRPGPVTAHGRLLRGSLFEHIPDVAASEDYRLDDPFPRALVDLAGGRTILAVPLRKDDAFLGDIFIYRQEVRPFNDKQIALLQNFAAQAVIAMENARLLGELRQRTGDLEESLEYQTATSDVLKVISGSTFDLQPVLETVVETAARLCKAEKAIVYRNEDGALRYAAGYSNDPDYERIERETPIYPGEGTVAGRAALHQRTVQILDSLADPLYAAKEEARIGAARSMIGVPLLREGAVVGVIALARGRVEPFTDKQIELVTTFADQAVIAIENARLLGELRARTDDLARSVEELKALGEVGQAVSSTLDLRAVLATILNRSVAMAGAEAGVIFRYARAERAFRFVEAVGYSEAMVREVRDLGVGETVTGMGEAVANRAPLQIPDLLMRPSNPLRDAALAAGFRSVLIVPLVGADRVMGATILQRRAAGEFPEATVRLMQALASQSVLAIQNARLFREIAEKSEQLAQASEHKSQFLANMSHELRTPLNAILGYTELMADGIYGELPPRATGVLERVQNNGRHLLALINDVLDLAKIEAGQLTLTLEDYALSDVVQSVVSATEGLANTKGIVLSADVMPGLPMGHGDARRLSQVLLNLVGNAVKFTDTGEVAIGAAADGGNFVLTVRDTGPGIAPGDHDKIFGEFQQIDNSNTRKKGGTGLGLAISKRMVEMQGGTISVDSELGQGATFRVTLPVRVEDMTGELTGELMGAA